MKRFQPIAFDGEECIRQVEEFRALLAANDDLSEKRHVLPFFRERRHVGSLLHWFNRKSGLVDRWAREFDIFGDFSCDLAVGDSSEAAYCFVEFENAEPDSIFIKRGRRATSEWSRRFDRGYGQIIDWAYKLATASRSDLIQRFGTPRINYEFVLVIGRDQYVRDEGERLRLEWRSERALIDNRLVTCITYDQLLRYLDVWKERYRTVPPEPFAGS